MVHTSDLSTGEAEKVDLCDFEDNLDYKENSMTKIHRVTLSQTK